MLKSAWVNSRHCKTIILGIGIDITIVVKLTTVNIITIIILSMVATMSIRYQHQLHRQNRNHLCPHRQH